jgi:hypothetical protein
MKMTKKELRDIIRESLYMRDVCITEIRYIGDDLLTETLADQRKDLLDNQYKQVSDDTRYPYGRNRGDVRRTTVYERTDGQPIPDSDVAVFKDHDDEVRKKGGSMAALGGVYTTKVSPDGMTLSIEYYRHTAG